MTRLQQGEELALLAAIVESSEDAIIALGLDGTILSWNSGARRIYGYRKDEVRGRSFGELGLPERLDEMEHILRRIRRGQRIQHLDTLHLRKDGKSFYVSLSIAPIIDRLGQVLGASIIARDITESRLAQQELREAEEKYRLIFSAETDAIVLFDAETRRVVDSNQASLNLYGYSREEFCGLRLDNLLLRPERWAKVAGRTQSGAVLRLPVFKHRKKDGAIFAAEMSTSCFVWKGRNMLVGIVRDVSEREKIQHIRQSLVVAREIQQYLLPQGPPQLARLDIAASSTYCEEIGGDYFDYLEFPTVEGRVLGFTVGDVSGHGVGSALLMAMTKGMALGQIERYGTDLEKIFFALNNQLVSSTDNERFMTLFWGMLDLQDLCLRWNSAGHGPVYCYRRADGSIEELETTGLPLGIFENERYAPSGPVCLRPGDLLLIGTDGLWEARNPAGEMFGTHRIRQALATWRDRSASAVLAAILERIRRFAGGERPEDDMTLMVVKVL